MSYQGPSTFGLFTSHVVASQNGVDAYKPASYLDDSQWWGNKAKAPASTQWNAPEYKAYSYGASSRPAPEYKGLQGGDYDRLEMSLRSPGEQAAKNAYESARRELADVSTARGMYGSSQFTRQMDGQANRTYLDALTSNAANAAAQRYQAQAQDQQFAQGQRMQAWQAGLADNQHRNELSQRENAQANQWAWNASTAERDWSDLMATRQADFENALAQSRQDWDMQRLQWETAQNDAAWERIYGIWGHVDPEIERYEKKLLKEQATASDQGSGLSGLVSSVGGLAGGLVGMLPGAGAFGGLLSAGSRLAGGFF